MLIFSDLIKNMSQTGNNHIGTFIEKIKNLNQLFNHNDIKHGSLRSLYLIRKLNSLHSEISKIGISKKLPNILKYYEFIVKDIHNVYHVFIETKWNRQPDINENDVIWIDQNYLPTLQEISEASTYWYKISSTDITDALAIVIFLIELEYDEKKDYIYSKTMKYENSESSEFEHATFTFWFESNYLDNVACSNSELSNTELSPLSQYWMNIFKKRYIF